MDHNKYSIFGNPESNTMFLQLIDEHDLDFVKRVEVSLTELTDDVDWCIAAVPVGDWNQELTPWPADPVFGKRAFGDGAQNTLDCLISEIIPSIENKYLSSKRRYILCGYSLAGLFSLWAAYQTDIFTGVVAASPSVWYPNWIQYAATHEIRSKTIYLSLGDREERTRNPIMSTVGQDIRELHQMYKERGILCQLDWNPGNHFENTDQRMTRGMAWVLNAAKG